MMKKLAFETDAELDSQFPALRICRVEIYTKDGKRYISRNCEPRGEACENIGIDWLTEKFMRITSTTIKEETQKELIAMICGDESISVRKIVDKANEGLLKKL